MKVKKNQNHLLLTETKEDPKEEKDYEIVVKKTKEKIPATVRNAVWVNYIGPIKATSMCFCCNSNPISISVFECGHIKSEHDGGKVHIDNLRPICGLCNKSMGTKDMVKFMQTYGFKQSRNWNGYVKAPRCIPSNTRCNIV